MFPRRLITSQLFSRCTKHLRPAQTNALKPNQPQQIITRSKQTKPDKKAISRAIEKNKQTPEPELEVPADNIFGMRPIDYTILPPICHSPPPPPPRPGMRKYIFPLSLVVFAGIFGYFYVNNKNDNLEFWMAMQNGEAIDVGNDEDDDDDEDED